MVAFGLRSLLVSCLFWMVFFFFLVDFLMCLEDLLVLNVLAIESLELEGKISSLRLACFKVKVTKGSMAGS